MNKESYNVIYKRVNAKIVLSVKRIYVLAFNAYAWYWLYRQIFVRHSTDFEEYLLWFFTVAGMYFFVLDNDDVYIKDNSKN